MTTPEELVPFSRIRLAQALKEDPNDPELVNKSALFIQLRNRQPQALTQSQHNIPRPNTLIVPPSLGNSEYPVLNNNIKNKTSEANLIAVNNGAQSKSNDPFRKGRIHSSPSLPSLPVSRHTPNHSPNGSISSISSSSIPLAPPISQQPNKQPNALIGTVSIQPRPTTLMDVRKSILDSRQIMTAFSPASSHRTSRLLHQKSYSDVKSQQALSRSPLSNSNSSSSSLPSLANTSNQSSSRPNSILNQSRPNTSQNLPRPASSHSNLSRPLSAYSVGKGNSRPPSIWGGYVPPVDSSEESSEESSEDEESGDEQENVSNAKKTEKTTSRPSGLPLLPPLSQLGNSKTPSPTSSPTRTSPTRTSPTRTSPTRTSPTRSSTKSPESGDDDVKVHTPTSISILEKVEEEKSDDESSESEEESDDGSSEGSSEESEEESEEDSGDESSDSDTPLALKMSDAPPRISVLSSSGKKSPRVEAWVSDVSRQSLVIDSRTFNPRKQRQSQVMGDLRPRKTSLTPDSAFDPRMRRPRSAYAMDESDFLPPQPQYRKRSNSEFTPGSGSQHRPLSVYSTARASSPLLLSTPVQLPKADTDDWAQDTILALSSKVPSSASPIPPPQKHRVVRSSASMTNMRAGTPPLSLPTPPRSPGELYIHHSRKQSGSNSSLNKLVMNGEGRRERGDRDRMEKRERERSYSASSQQQGGRRRDHAGMGYGPVGMSSPAANRISMYGGAAHRRVASDHVSKGDNMMYYNSQHTQFKHRRDLQT